MFVQKACRPLLAIVLGMCFYGTGQANPPPLNPLDFKHDRMSPGSFSLLAKLSLRDNGGVRDSLDYGTGPGATDGIDAQFGEEELPPLPPTGVFDVRWRISGTQGTKRDIRDTLGGTRRQITFKGVIQAGPGGYPFHLRWNRTELPAGTFTLRYGYGSWTARSAR